MTPPPLDWDDMQGNILRGYGFDHARHVVLSISEPIAARRWIGSLVPTITPATPWNTQRPTTALNVAFTHRGLAALGLDADALASFPADFREGMRARAERYVGDVDEDAPQHWESAGVQSASAHVLLMIHARSAEAADGDAADAHASASNHGLDLVGSEQLANLRSPDDGAVSPRRIEHFGFTDGISQPAVEGAIEPTAVRGNGTPLGGDEWRPVRAGEFVLGYPDEEEEAPPHPTPTVLARNGSYLVYRKLTQDVAAFRRLAADHAERHGIAPELVAAKLVGRQPDGTPLVPPPVGGTMNDVRYVGDGQGQLCPVGSHIRRTNPRDALGLKPELVSRHRLLRRGMPYGPPLPEGVVEDDGVERGLLFVAYCASIRRQFEFVQREWMNDGNVFGAGHTPDPIAGHGSAPRRFAFEGPSGCGILLTGLPRLVRPVGGEYLFQPGLRGLRHLATLED